MLTPAYTHQGDVLIIATRLLKMNKGVLDVVHFFDLIMSLVVSGSCHGSLEIISKINPKSLWKT